MILPSDVRTRLIENFSFGDMIWSDTAHFLGICNIPDFTSIDNLRFMCKVLEVIREHVECPIVVNSGYRSPSLNKQVKGAINSLHLKGCAVDFTIRKYQDSDFNALHAWIYKEMPWLSECFYYKGRNFIHVAYSPTKTMPCFKIINPKN